MKNISNIKLVLFVLLFGFLVFWIKGIDDLRFYDMARNGLNESSDKIYFDGEKRISQYININKDCNAFELFVGNEKELADSNVLYIELCYADSNKIAQWIVYDYDISGDWQEFRTTEMLRAGSSYLINIYCSNNIPDDSIYVLCDNGINRGEMYIDGKIQEYCLGIATYKAKVNYYAYLSILVFIFTFVLSISLKKYDLNIKAPLILVGIGISTFLIISPGCAPDEIYHYSSSLELSNVLLGNDNVDIVQTELGTINGLDYKINSNSSFVTMTNTIGKKGIYGGEISRIYEHSDFPICYIPQAVGITFGRILNLSPIWIYNLGRLANLLSYSFITTIAIWLLPQKKELLLLIAILPMSIHQAVSLSYDAMLNATAWLVVAYVIKLATDNEKIKVKNLFFIGVMLLILSPIKVVYFTIGLIIFIIPIKKYVNRPAYIWGNVTVLAFSFLGVLLLQIDLITRALGKTSAMNNNASTYSALYIIQEPIKFLYYVGYTLDAFLSQWASDLIGQRLASINLYVSEYIITGFAILLLLLSLNNESDNNSLNRVQKVIICITCLTTILGIMVALMSSKTYDVKFIAGIQGRYFLPILLPICLLLNTNWIVVKKHRIDIFNFYWFLEIATIGSIVSSIVY